MTIVPRLSIPLLLFLPLMVGCNPSPGGGKTLYVSRCAFCHGDSGGGDGPAGLSMQPAPPDFTNAKFWQGRTSATLETAILKGKPGSAMPGYQGTLSQEELGALVNYLQGFRTDGGTRK